MPIYVYEIVNSDGSAGKRFDHFQSIHDAPLTKDPTSGLPVRRILCPPYITSRYSPGKSQALLDNKRVEKAGFTKYEKDKLTGTYHRVAGKEGPTSFKKPES